MFSKILQLLGLKNASDSAAEQIPEPFVPPRRPTREELQDTFGPEDLEQTAEQYFVCGLSAWKCSDLDAALNDINTAVEYSPERADWLLNRGNLFFELGRYSDALSAFERALQIIPSLDDGVLFINYHMIKQFGIDSPTLKAVAEQNRQKRQQRPAR